MCSRWSVDFWRCTFQLEFRNSIFGMRIEKDRVDGLFLDNTFRNIQKMRLRKLSDHSHGGELSNDFVLFGLVKWVNLSEVWKNKETSIDYFCSDRSDRNSEARKRFYDLWWSNTRQWCEFCAANSFAISISQALLISYIFATKIGRTSLLNLFVGSV